MNQQYFHRWTQILKNAQQPMQEFTTLNVKTVQSLKYLKPDELVHLKPEEFFDKQVNLSIENGHKALDYMQKAFEILEKTMLSAQDNLKETRDFIDPDNIVKETSDSMSKSAELLNKTKSMLDPLTHSMINSAQEAFNLNAHKEDTIAKPSSKQHSASSDHVKAQAKSHAIKQTTKVASKKTTNNNRKKASQLASANAASKAKARTKKTASTQAKQKNSRAKLSTKSS